MLAGTEWQEDKFNLTNALSGLSKLSVDQFIVDIIPDKMTDGKIYLRFSPAQLIVRGRLISKSNPNPTYSPHDLQ
jgi:hypothetical protein